MSRYTAQDGTRYEVSDTTRVRRRSPPKPYRDKAERKIWKRARQRAARLK